MSFKGDVEKVFVRITGKSPLASYNNSPMPGRCRTIKLQAVSASDEELDQLDQAYREDYGDRYLGLRNMVASVYYGNEVAFKEPKVVVRFKE